MPRIAELSKSWPSRRQVKARSASTCVSPMRRGPAAWRCKWCGREDSNFHGLSATATSTLRVYQFRHDRTFENRRPEGRRWQAGASSKRVLAGVTASGRRRSPSVEEHRHALDPHQPGAIGRPVVERADVDRLAAVQQRVDRHMAVIAVASASTIRPCSPRWSSWTARPPKAKPTIRSIASGSPARIR